MALLYTPGTMICKLWEQFSRYFSEETAPTKKHLFDLVLSVLALNGFQSVKFNYEHFIEEISDFKLKSYYFTLNDSRIELSDWMKRLTETALAMIPPQQGQQPIILSIDDTMIEKFGKKFENRSRLFDHAAHNGSNYLNGHCFVSLLLSIPIQDETSCRYLSFPVGYRMWTKDQTKLSMAADLVCAVMKIIGDKRNVCLCRDS